MTDDEDLQLGAVVAHWTPPPVPARSILQGRHCQLEPLHAATHAQALHAANALDTTGANWNFLPYGPFASFEQYREWLGGMEVSADPLFFTVVDPASGAPTGLASYLRIEPRHGCIEIGHLAFSPLLQRTIAATEALYLMIDLAFTLGYRRCEWKCNALNAASRAAALRLGFRFEGIFHQHQVIKGRNRDTAWFAIVDTQWPALRAAFERWLAPGNFDAQGRQRQRLAELRGSMAAF